MIVSLVQRAFDCADFDSIEIAKDKLGYENNAGFLLN